MSVRIITFDKLLENHKDITHIDFLSLDVEGGEMTILKTINFSKYSFGILTIENNEPGNTLTTYMQKQGYNELCRVGVDIMFIKV